MRKMMLGTVVLLAISGLGCGGEEGDNTWLLHPISGEIIGYVVAGDYHLDDRIIRLGTIERVVLESSPQLAHTPSTAASVGPLRPTGELCWKLHQDGLECDGCCTGLKCRELCAQTLP